MKKDIWEMVGAYPACNHCQSNQVVRDAWTEWSQITHTWELKTTFDNFACDACGEIITPEWRLDDAFRKKRIRRLNDAVRKGQEGTGTIVVTAGVQALGSEFLQEANAAITAFEDFNADNDPHLEHDFGSVEVSGERLFFKIDYYDLTMTALSPDTADPNVTHRVMTIMLAGEY